MSCGKVLGPFLSHKIKAENNLNQTLFEYLLYARSLAWESSLDPCQWKRETQTILPVRSNRALEKAVVLSCSVSQLL